jgi:hypothetical protein
MFCRFRWALLFCILSLAQLVLCIFINI